MTTLPPGALTPSVDRTGRFVDLVKSLPDETVVFADARVLRLHRDVAKSLSKRTVIPLTAGEGLKSLATIERVSKRLSGVSRSATTACEALVTSATSKPALRVTSMVAV